MQSFVDSPEIADMLRKLGGGAGTITDTFFATELRFAAIGAAALGIALTTRMRTEETTGRLEAVLATPATRLRWALSHLLGVAGRDRLRARRRRDSSPGSSTGSEPVTWAAPPGGCVGAALATLPAVWVCVAVAVLLVGLVPRLTGLAWAVLIGFLVLGEFGVLMGLPSVAHGDLSPFDHLLRAAGRRPSRRLLWSDSSSSARASPRSGSPGCRRRDIG